MADRSLMRPWMILVATVGIVLPSCGPDGQRQESLNRGTPIRVRLSSLSLSGPGGAKDVTSDGYVLECGITGLSRGRLQEGWDGTLVTGPFWPASVERIFPLAKDLIEKAPPGTYRIGSERDRSAKRKSGPPTLEIETENGDIYTYVLVGRPDWNSPALSRYKEFHRTMVWLWEEIPHFFRDKPSTPISPDVDVELLRVRLVVRPESDNPWVADVSRHGHILALGTEQPRPVPVAMGVRMNRQAIADVMTACMNVVRHAKPGRIGYASGSGPKFGEDFDLHLVIRMDGKVQVAVMSYEVRQSAEGSEVERLAPVVDVANMLYENARSLNVEVSRRLPMLESPERNYFLEAVASDVEDRPTQE